MDGRQRHAAVAGRDERARACARLRVDRKAVRRHHAQRRPRARRRATSRRTRKHVHGAPRHRRQDAGVERLVEAASCCASPISTVPSSVWRIVSIGTDRNGAHALEHDDLPLVRRDRRAQARPSARAARCRGRRRARRVRMRRPRAPCRSANPLARGSIGVTPRSARAHAAARATRRRAARAADAADCSRRRARTTCRRRRRGRCRAAVRASAGASSTSMS